MESRIINNCIFIVFLIGIGGCDNPFMQTDEVDHAELLHGTWMYQNSSFDSLKITFDSDSMRFLDQYGYKYGLRREFIGSFIMTDTSIQLKYDHGHIMDYAYIINQNNLIFTTGISSWQLAKVSSKSNLNGWSTKLRVSSEYTINNSKYSTVSHLGISNIGTIALAEEYNDNDPSDIDLINISVGGATFIENAPNVRAIDSHGQYLWIVNEFKVIQRTINDTTTISSFNYRYTESDSAVFGIAVYSDYLYLLVHENGNEDANLIKYTLNGTLISTIRTSRTLNDMCIFDNRLFCLTGSETFVELDITTGMAVQNYNVQNRPFELGNNIDGIAYTGSEIQISCGLRISNLIIHR